jgi:hypothetical protein
MQATQLMLPACILHTGGDSQINSSFKVRASSLIVPIGGQLGLPASEKRRTHFFF